MTDIQIEEQVATKIFGWTNITHHLDGYMKRPQLQGEDPEVVVSSHTGYRSKSIVPAYTSRKDSWALIQWCIKGGFSVEFKPGSVAISSGGEVKAEANEPGPRGLCLAVLGMKSFL